LSTQNITTLPQLTAIADRIERLPGVGRKTALALRAELGRIALPDA
jgi:endonuclease III